MLDFCCSIGEIPLWSNLLLFQCYANTKWIVATGNILIFFIRGSNDLVKSTTLHTNWCILIVVHGDTHIQGVHTIIIFSGIILNGDAHIQAVHTIIIMRRNAHIYTIHIIIIIENIGPLHDHSLFHLDLFHLELCTILISLFPNNIGRRSLFLHNPFVFLLIKSSSFGFLFPSFKINRFHVVLIISSICLLCRQPHSIHILNSLFINVEGFRRISTKDGKGRRGTCGWYRTLLHQFNHGLFFINFGRHTQNIHRINWWKMLLIHVSVIGFDIDVASVGNLTSSSNFPNHVKVHIHRISSSFQI